MAEEMLIQKFVNDELTKIMEVLNKMDSYKVFDEPVPKKFPKLARNYRSKIKEPMDFHTMSENIKKNYYKFFELDKFVRHFVLVCQNCMDFNADPESVFHRIAQKFLVAGMKVVEPVIEVLRERSKLCKEYKIPASDVGTGCTYPDRVDPVALEEPAQETQEYEDEEEEEEVVF